MVTLRDDVEQTAAAVAAAVVVDGDDYCFWLHRIWECRMSGIPVAAGRTGWWRGPSCRRRCLAEYDVSVLVSVSQLIVSNRKCD